MQFSFNVTPDLIRGPASSGAARNAAFPRLVGRGDAKTGDCPTPRILCHDTAMTYLNSFSILRPNPSLSAHFCFAS